MQISRIMSFNLTTTLQVDIVRIINVIIIIHILQVKHMKHRPMRQPGITKLTSGKVKIQLDLHK